MRDPIRAKSSTDAWLQAAEHLRRRPDWRDYNLVLEISRPMSLSADEKRICANVNEFLVSRSKHPISTVINTLFPASFYCKYGAAGLFERYRGIRPRLCGHDDWKWGTYFGRMVSRIDPNGKEICPLEYLIAKLRRQVEAPAPKRAIYELNLVEPFLDIPIYDAGTDKGYHMGGPCLSHLSVKLKGDQTLLLTAIYRSHYYIERALGNFYGLAMLQDFVATQAGTKAAELVCHSTMAVLDTEPPIRRKDAAEMLDACARLSAGNLDAPKLATSL